MTKSDKKGTGAADGGERERRAWIIVTFAELQNPRHDETTALQSSMNDDFLGKQ